ncbi:MAG: histidine triad nucleotide-binding protein [Chlamydia sp.]
MTDQKTLFSKIIDRDIPAEIVFENDQIIAFRDIEPQAPVHILIVPKKPIKNIQDLSREELPLIGEIIITAKEIAQELGVGSDFRVVTNSGQKAGQTVFHLHFHLLGGALLGPIC